MNVNDKNELNSIHRFLDSRIFATCSDDSTVALFDSRNLKSRIRTLQGHSNWVKNIEYSKKDCLLVTSAFDGSILTWELNSCTESNHYTRVRISQATKNKHYIYFFVYSLRFLTLLAS